MINLFNENGFNIKGLSYDSFSKIKFYNLNNADRQIVAILNDGVNEEEKGIIENELLSESSPFVLTSDYDYNIVDKDFRLFDVTSINEYDNLNRIISISYYINNVLAVKEDIEYIYSNNLNINKNIKWYRLDGSVGITKTLNRVYSNISDIEDKNIEIRKNQIKRIKEMLHDSDTVNYNTNILSLNNDINNYINNNNKVIITSVNNLLGLNINL